MTLAERIGLPVLRALDPETAHGIAIWALRKGFVPTPGPVTSIRLSTEIAGIAMPNPIGLAAGFDKNAEVLGPLMQAGFGFLEVGAATPRAQKGNPRPRLYRLSEDRGAINRFGFNNQGADLIGERLAARPAGIPVGLNLGANKDSADRAADFAKVLRVCGPHSDFVTVNVSSPNTEKLRDLQGKAALAALLDGVLDARSALRRPIPVFLKIAPDLDDAGLSDIAALALEKALDGIIATNTTLARDGLRSRYSAEKGGLSGAPLFERSTRVLARLSELTDGTVPLIGVGGVGSAEQALAKIEAGAWAVQLYTAMVFHGLSLAGDIARGLDTLLAERGFSNVSQAVGTDRARWLT